MERLERLETRLTGRQKALLKQAAALQITRSAPSSAADTTVGLRPMISLGAEASAALASALLDPPDPNPKLRAAAERYLRP